MPNYVDINAPSNSKRIPILAFASFAMGTEAQVYVAHLPRLAADLSVSIAEAGLLSAAFALTYAIAAPLVALKTSAIDRRSLLLSGLVAIGLLNLAAAIVPSFIFLVALRVAAGVAAGAVGPTASASAAALAAPEKRGRAMAIVLGGMTLAFVVGIPAGAVIGQWGGWRSTFIYAGVIALVAAIAIRLSIPRIGAAAPTQKPSLTVLLLPDVRTALLTTVVGFAATFTIVGYIAPVAHSVADLQGSQVGVLQMLIGVGSIIGILVGIRSADSARRSTMIAITFLVSAGSLAINALLTRGMFSEPMTVILFGLGMLSGSAALFARTPMVQAQLVKATPPQGTTLALGLNGSMALAGQGLGALAGAATLAVSGINMLGFSGAVIALLGCWMTLRPSGVRALQPALQC